MFLRRIVIHVGIPSILGFICGLYYFPQTIAARDAASNSGDGRSIHLAHLFVSVSQILLWGGLLFTILSVVGYLFCQKWIKDGHDA